MNKKDAQPKMALAMPKVKSSGDFKTLISRFTIPIELLDDIIYCQRSLRLYMRVHQVSVAVRGCSKLPK